ncbi:DNA primase large subunit isoform X5 [Fukomys damarensis]|uniref:DNA primase large subunit isoform X5 n=1 Tax=Fukomys damarensis TaxID=885580 RepID=UPI0014555BFA|nr:DNA primase large subunit isoform X5 [Fukomys damarensis]
MQFSGANRRKLRLAGDQKNACYPHSLQFYLEPPSENISLIEFENLAIDRLKLLKTVENLGVRYVKGTEQYQSKLESEIRKLKFSFRENLEDEYEPRRKDHISHFILRLAYCQSEDLRRWFIQQEMDLLRFRFTILPKDKIQNFLKDSHLQFEAISDEEKNHREQEIIASSVSLSGAQLELESVYKIPFADALDLFRGRRVYLEDGFAYVPLKDIVAIILNEFRAKLSKALAFDRGYSYNIRHSFGKEGKRTDYTPYSCMKIILTNPPGQGDYHGCPFRHSDPELLKQKLHSYKISPQRTSQILDLVKGTHYQVACQKYFEMIHNVDDCGFSLNHPNQFFDESQRILNGGKDIKKESVLPETQAKPGVQKTKDTSCALSSLNSSLEADMEGLEDYFSQ